MKKSLNIIAAAFIGAIIGSIITDIKASHDQKLKLLLPDTEGEERYDFAMNSTISLDHKSLPFDEITLIQQTPLTTFKPEHVQDICFDTQPHGDNHPGEYELSLHITFNSPYRKVLHQILKSTENTYLKLEYRGLIVLEGVLSPGNADTYARKLAEYPDVYDTKLTAWHGNHAGLVELAQALSPNKMPEGCNANFKTDHFNKEGRAAAQRLWKS